MASGFCAPGSKDILTLPNATAVPLEKAKSIYNKPSANSTACIFNLRAVTQVWLGLIFRTTAKSPAPRQRAPQCTWTLIRREPPQPDVQGQGRHSPSRRGSQQPRRAGQLWLSGRQLRWGWSSLLWQLVWHKGLFLGRVASCFNLKIKTGITKFDVRLFSASAIIPHNHQRRSHSTEALNQDRAGFQKGHFPSICMFFFKRGAIKWNSSCSQWSLSREVLTAEPLITVSSVITIKVPGCDLLPELQFPFLLMLCLWKGDVGLLRFRH